MQFGPKISTSEKDANNKKNKLEETDSYTYF